MRLRGKEHRLWGTQPWARRPSIRPLGSGRHRTEEDPAIVIVVSTAELPEAGDERSGCILTA